MPTKSNGCLKQVMEDCELSDLGFSSPQFTWNNGRSSNDFTKNWLDRGVANKEWCDLHDGVEVSILACRSSDHNSLLVIFHPID